MWPGPCHTPVHPVPCQPSKLPVESVLAASHRRWLSPHSAQARPLLPGPGEQWVNGGMCRLLGVGSLLDKKKGREGRQGRREEGRQAEGRAWGTAGRQGEEPLQAVLGCEVSGCILGSLGRGSQTVPTDTTDTSSHILGQPQPPAPGVAGATPGLWAAQGGVPLPGALGHQAARFLFLGLPAPLSAFPLLGPPPLRPRHLAGFVEVGVGPQHTAA